MIVCSGVLFVSKAGRVLLLKRADNGVWNFPGGHVEDGETVRDGAIRECIEEIGSCPEGADLWQVTTTEGEVNFTTFARSVVDEFAPVLNDENTEAAWLLPSELPADIIPGCAAAVQRLNMTELDVAKSIANGVFLSPVVFHNIFLVAIRITGTGVAWRDAVEGTDANGMERVGEFVFRDPEAFLNDDFVSRCNSIPVLMGHPDTNVISSSEDYTRRNVGSVMYPYVKSDEVWGIARIYSADAAKKISREPQSTSPGVLIGPERETIDLKGTRLMVEGKPVLLDHIAICPQGVWDKGGPPSGVDSPQVRGLAMADEQKPGAEAPRADATPPAGAEGSAPEMAIHEKILQALTGLTARLDKHDDAIEALLANNAGRADDANNADNPLVPGNPMGPSETITVADGVVDAGQATDTVGGELSKIVKTVETRGDAVPEVPAPNARADEDADQKVADACAKADAANRKNAALEAQIAQLQRAMNPTDADRNAITEIQSRADSVMSLYGKSARRPMAGEAPQSYLRRVAGDLKGHSKAWKDVDLSALSGPVLTNATDAIFADARADAAMPSYAQPEAPLHAVTKTSASGHRVTTFRGHPRQAWQKFGMPVGVGKLARKAV